MKHDDDQLSDICAKERVQRAMDGYALTMTTAVRR